MSQSPTTRSSLLLRLRDNEPDAWSQFVEIYSPLVHAYVRHRGLQDADAADLTQEVLGVLTSAMSAFDYDPQRGSFRGWLFTVTRNKLQRWADKHHRQARGTGDTATQALLREQPNREADEALWNRQHQWRLFEYAAERVRPQFSEATWQAFWRVAVEQQPAAEVAEVLGLSVGAVYVAKSRALARIKEFLETIEPDQS